ncbi:MAG: ECF transporter S component [Bacillota bacterium]
MKRDAPPGPLGHFTIFDLVVISLMACLGIATKPIVVPLAHMITGPLFIPGGVLAGGFYMMWIVLGAALVKRRGAGTAVALIQALMVMSLGIYGTHGLASVITYVPPGIAVDLVLTIYPGNSADPIRRFSAGIAANMTGTFLVNLTFFRLPLVPLLLSISTAALSGGLGGWIAHGVATRFSGRFHR